MLEMQEFWDNMKTEVCDHYFILNKSETQSSTINPTVLNLELTVVTKSNSFYDKTIKNVLLESCCTKTLIKINTWNFLCFFKIYINKTISLIIICMVIRLLEAVR
jgi:hypothetical protein